MSEEAEAVSVADTLRAARDELAGEAEAEETAAPEPEAAPDDTEDAVEASEEAPEGDDGGEAAEPEGDGEPEPLKAPQSWSADDAKAFAELPRAVQETIVRREREREGYLTKRTQELSPWANLSNKYQPYFESLGTDPASAMEALLGAERVLRSGTPQQKLAAYQRLAQDYGITELLNTQQRANGSSNSDDDPELAAALRPLQDEIRALKADREQEVANARQSQVAALEKVAGDFIAETTGAGDLAHPYVENDTVFTTMNALVAAEHAAGSPMNHETLQRCYDQACWADPGVRARILEDQRVAERRDEARKKQAEAEKARKASKGLGAGTGRGVHSRKEAPTTESVGDTLRAAMAELSAAGQ